MIEIPERRTETSKTFSLGGGKFRLEAGNHCHYKDDDGLYQDVDLSAPDIQGSVYRFEKNRVRVFVDTSTGKLRIYPFRRDNSKYIEMGSVTDVSVSVEVVNGRFIRVYKNTPNVNYNFIISDQGVKIWYVLKNSSAPDTFQFHFRLEGLQRRGRTIMDGARELMVMPDPALLDGATEEQLTNTVTEGIDDGAAIATVQADLAGVTFPVILDPSIGPFNPSADTSLRISGPDTNYASGYLDLISSWSQIRALFRFSISSIPAGSTIDQADIRFWLDTSTVQKTIEFYRITANDWFENTVTWNSRYPGAPWTTPGGDYDHSARSTILTPAAPTYMTFNGNGSADLDVLCQNALAAGSGTFELLARRDIEGSDPSVHRVGSRRNLTPAFRPQLTVEYSEVGTPIHIFHQGGCSCL